MGSCTWADAGVNGQVRGVLVRDATRADVKDVLELERQCFSDPWSEASFRSLPDEPRVDFYVAELEGRIAGYSVLWSLFDEGELANLAVSPDLRWKGIGRLMLREGLERLRRRGATKIFLELRASNEAARRLYESAGFSELHRRKGYYRRPVEDAIVMQWNDETRGSTFADGESDNNRMSGEGQTYSRQEEQ
jgi:[ribosomal protein S18]-alanine N-acetyltransferase